MCLKIIPRSWTTLQSIGNSACKIPLTPCPRGLVRHFLKGLMLFNNRGGLICTIVIRRYSIAYNVFAAWFQRLPLGDISVTLRLWDYSLPLASQWYRDKLFGKEASCIIKHLEVAFLLNFNGQLSVATVQLASRAKEIPCPEEFIILVGRLGGCLRAFILCTTLQSCCIRVCSSGAVYLLRWDENSRSIIHRLRRPRYKQTLCLIWLGLW